MFTRIVLEGFGSIPHIEFDLRGPRGRPLNLALVYGENCSGKTHLVESVAFLKRTLTTLSDLDLFDRSGGSLGGARNLRQLSRRYMMFGAEWMHVRYEFHLAGGKGDYDLVFNSEGNLLREELRHATAKGKIGRYYLVESGADGPEMSFGRGVFRADLSRELRVRASRLWGPNTMLSIILSERERCNQSFFEMSALPGVSDVLGFIMSLGVNLDPFRGRVRLADGRLIDLRSGRLPYGDARILDTYGDVLSSFLIRLFSDVRKVCYARAHEDGDVVYELMVEREVAGRVMSVPIGRESSGTRLAVEMLPALLACCRGGVAFVDDFGTGIHDGMVRDLMAQLLQEMDGQLVVTTHSTILMEIAEPRNVFVLRVDRHGYKDLSSLPSITPTRRGRKVRTDYMNGKYEGVPLIRSLGLRGLVMRLDDIRE